MWSTQPALHRFPRKQALGGSQGRGMWRRWESTVVPVVSFSFSLSSAVNGAPGGPGVSTEGARKSLHTHTHTVTLTKVKQGKNQVIWVIRHILTYKEPRGSRVSESFKALLTGWMCLWLVSNYRVEAWRGQTLNISQKINRDERKVVKNLNSWSSRTIFFFSLVP